MKRYIAKRLVLMFILLIGLTFIVFASLYLAPGDPAEIAAGLDATQEQIQQMREYLGLDRSFAVQYLTYLSNLLHGDLGTSYMTRQPILDELLVRLPNTLNLAVSSMIMACIIGIPLGIIAAIKKDSILDNLLTTISLFGISVPNFWLGSMLIIIFCVHFQIFPTGGMTEPFWTARGFMQAFLPSLSLGMQVAAGFMRIGRSSMLDVLQADYTRTARSKGLKERTVITVHALRNAMIPIMTQMGTSFGGLLGGAMVTEQVFAINGIGSYLITAINQRNYTAVQSTVLVIAFMFVVVNLIVDILYSVVDPRIRFE